ncbi:hypothetical protein [Pseudomonas asturiensis]|uniref:hypothetical protein n=1 Tax=Pseudomonas asturiensis TaxID=1190415 RepID=UPI001130996E|nr:hypothetical protein [Pseudomonas asturiensis]
MLALKETAIDGPRVQVMENVADHQAPLKSGNALTATRRSGYVKECDVFESQFPEGTQWVDGTGFVVGATDQLCRQP